MMTPERRTEARARCQIYILNGATRHSVSGYLDDALDTIDELENALCEARQHIDELQAHRARVDEENAALRAELDALRGGVKL